MSKLAAGVLRFQVVAPSVASRSRRRWRYSWAKLLELATSLRWRLWTAYTMFECLQNHRIYSLSSLLYESDQTSVVATPSSANGHTTQTPGSKTRARHAQNTHRWLSLLPFHSLLHSSSFARNIQIISCLVHTDYAISASPFPPCSIESLTSPWDMSFSLLSPPLV